MKIAFNKFFDKIKNFCKDNFEITTKNGYQTTGAIVAFVLLLLVVLQSRQFFSLEIKAKWLLLAFALVAPLIIGLTIAFSIKITKEKFNNRWHFIMFFLFPIVTMTMTEALNLVFVYDMTYLGFFANYVVILLFQFFVFAICGSFRVVIISINSVLFGLALGHAYVVEILNKPFVPMDFISITTAAGVANTYDFSFKYHMICATLIYIFVIIVGIKTKTPVYKTTTKIASRTFMGTFFACVIFLFYFTPIFANAGIKPDFWNQSRGYRNYGFVYNFFSNTRYLWVSKPDGYTPEKVDDAVYDLIGEHIYNPSGDQPNIICIMNESLSDLSVLGDFETNEEYMPFLNGLTENTVKGNLYVPVIGAGTSNTEFEFLTGHTTAFLPSGSNAYMLYIKNHIASLVSTLEHQGYSSYALHPYYAKGWNRIDVYNHFGFDKFISLENLIDSSIIKEFTKNGSDADYLQQLIETYYPDRQNMLIRQYVSDEYNYDLIIKDFENRDKSKPYFTFNVTMQNHGGYTTSASNFNENIYITSEDTVYPKTNKYLSLVKASDDAFKDLVEYFEGVDEPTIICMFGDHQPSIEPEFVESMLDANSLSSLSLKQEQQRHVTPFYIWANYDIEENYIEKLSSNYLSSYLLEIAGVELTPYNKYLIELSKTLPVIDTIGYIDSNNEYFNWTQKSDYSDLLKNYEYIQYNAIFDDEHVVKDIFYIDTSSNKE